MSLSVDLDLLPVAPLAGTAVLEGEDLGRDGPALDGILVQGLLNQVGPVV